MLNNLQQSRLIYVMYRHLTETKLPKMITLVGIWLYFLNTINLTEYAITIWYWYQIAIRTVGSDMERSNISMFVTSNAL